MATHPLLVVVDDDTSILRALRRLLGAAGFTVSTFASGEDFLASDGVDAIGCLVLDVQLDGLSGFDVAERLKTAPRSIPIVFITAHDDAVTRARAERVAGAQYLPKPFEDSALIGAIHRALTPV